MSIRSFSEIGLTSSEECCMDSFLALSDRSERLSKDDVSLSSLQVSSKTIYASCPSRYSLKVSSICWPTGCPYACRTIQPATPNSCSAFWTVSRKPIGQPPCSSSTTSSRSRRTATPIRWGDILSLHCTNFKLELRSSESTPSFVVRRTRASPNSKINEWNPSSRRHT